MRLTIVITGLDTGGAEMMLLKLLIQLAAEGKLTVWGIEVLSLIPPGAIGERIQALGVPVRGLGLRRTGGGAAAALDAGRAAMRLAMQWRARPPSLVQTWMYHADLVGGLAARMAGVPVVRNVRHANLDADVNRGRTLGVVRACARLSRRVPRQIVINSETARRAHAAVGYPDDKMRVIPNGFDLEIFHPDPAAREAVRAELGLPPPTPLIGMLARFHPQKDFATLCRAIGEHVRSEGEAERTAAPPAHWLLAGEGVDPANAELSALLKDHVPTHAQDRIHRLGRRSDAPRLMAALDVATLSSLGEAFPNVLGEAMACGVPCVSTAAGDAAEIVGDTGRVVPVGDAAGLAAGWRRLLALGPDERRARGAAARARVAERYAIGAIAAQYEALWREVLTKPDKP